MCENASRLFIRASRIHTFEGTGLFMAFKGDSQPFYFFPSSIGKDGAVRAGAYSHAPPSLLFPSLTEESARAKSRGAAVTHSHVRDDSLAGDATAGTASHSHGRDTPRESNDGSHFVVCVFVIRREKERPGEGVWIRTRERVVWLSSRRVE